METTLQPQMTSIVIDFPKVDFKRLKGIAKAMGWKLRKEEKTECQDTTNEEGGWEASPELLERLEKARKEIREGNCICCKTPEELQTYLNSL